ncbi:MAG TPA: FAD-dependent monooxygenase [Kofleriaceae bacterium]|nr:FAD-dependent monooxygenase [Kofleriaceae bacterium]
MRIVSVGGGPAGLYLGILMKRADPGHQVIVLERNRPDDTFGFGVVFSDATLENLGRADPESYAAIRGSFAHWDDIDIHWRGEMLRSTGHGFCGMERRVLLQILQDRCRELGVELHFEREVRDLDELAREADVVLGADGVASHVRAVRAAGFGPEIDVRPNRFVWLGTTFPFQSFTFYFKENEHGLWRVHAYRYRESGSTFIVETTAEAFTRAGLVAEDEDASIAYLERLFADELAGHRLIKNRSIWRSFPTVRNRSWHDRNVVLLGDAAHTAHFSIGSGTKLAMEDSIALASALVGERDVEAALDLYERTRRPSVESLQRAAQVSLEWFEGTERYRAMDGIQLAFSLMTRSLRVSHDGLARRDPALVARLDAWFAARAGVETRSPALVPVRLGAAVLENRIAVDGVRGGPAGGAGLGLPGFDGVRPALMLGGERAGAPRIARIAAGDPGLTVARAADALAAGADAVLVGESGAGVARMAHVALADRVRNETGATTIVAGGIASLDDVSTIVAAGRADLCVVDRATR